MSRQRQNTHRQAGFTIIELMIATTVLSIILLLVTIMLISIGNLYDKGINLSRIQDDVRTITNDVADRLQLSNTVTSTSSSVAEGSSSVVEGAVCIDTTRYSYVLGVEIGHQLEVSGVGQGATFQHILWRDTVASGSACTPADLTLSQPSTDGTEMISANSSLTAFSVSDSSPFTVQVNAAYGDTSLLASSGPNTGECSGQAGGDQYCATSSLTTTVVQRLTGSVN